MPTKPQNQTPWWSPATYGRSSPGDADKRESDIQFPYYICCWLSGVTYIRPIPQCLTNTTVSLFNWNLTSLFHQNCSFKDCHYLEYDSTHQPIRVITRAASGSREFCPQIPQILFSLGFHEPYSRFSNQLLEKSKDPKLTKSQTVLLHFIINPSSLPFFQTCSLC